MAAHWLHTGCTLAAHWLHNGCTASHTGSELGCPLGLPHALQELADASSRDVADVAGRVGPVVKHAQMELERKLCAPHTPHPPTHPHMQHAHTHTYPPHMQHAPTRPARRESDAMSARTRPVIAGLRLGRWTVTGR